MVFSANIECPQYSRTYSVRIIVYIMYIHMICSYNNPYVCINRFVSILPHMRLNLNGYN